MPSAPRLSRDRVLAAAVALADREGVEALSVRRLAEVLGVHPTSLYNHVASKEALLDGVVDLLLSELDPTPADTWQQWVRGVAVALRGSARAHPGAFMVLTRRPSVSPAALALAEGGLAAFRRAGVPVQLAVPAVHGVSLALLGLAINECHPLGDWDALVDQVPRQDLPHLAEAEQALDPAATDQHWDVVVDALVAGLSLLSPAAGTRPPHR